MGDAFGDILDDLRHIIDEHEDLINDIEGSPGGPGGLRELLEEGERLMEHLNSVEEVKQDLLPLEKHKVPMFKPAYAPWYLEGVNFAGVGRDEVDLTEGSLSALMTKAALDCNSSRLSHKFYGETTDKDKFVEELLAGNPYVLYHRVSYGGDIEAAFCYPEYAVCLEMKMVLEREDDGHYQDHNEWLNSRNQTTQRYTVHARVEMFSPAYLEGAQDLIARHVMRPTLKSNGKVYMMMTGAGGKLTLKKIGVAGIPMEYDNYAPEMRPQLEHIIADLGTSNPCGRLIVLDGPPGTGKTFCVRGLVDSVRDALFVIVPPDMLSRLSSPDFLPVLLGVKTDEKIPIVIIAEDADQCLARRAADNIVDIGSLLNLSDGILGSLLDIRILATTNAHVKELDAAMMRPGRLCKRVEFGKLSLEQAEKVYQRLTKSEDKLPAHPTKQAFTVAEVYTLVKTGLWLDTEKVSFRDSKGAGFGR